MAGHENRISVGELRQNPTRMLRDVKTGASYVVTDHGEPIAQIVPRREQRWLPSALVDDLLRDLGPDDAWARDVAAIRAVEPASDPWESAG